MIAPTLAPTPALARLTLRPLHHGDFAAIAAMYQTDRAAFIGGKLPPVRVWYGFASDVGSWVLQGFGGWAVDLADGTTVGQVALTHPVHYPEPELGWLLYDGFEGRGFATEAALAARDYAMGTLGWPTLVSYIDPENHPSQAVAARLGGLRDPTAATPNNDPTWVYRYGVAV